MYGRMNAASEAQLEVVYDGSALKHGTMEVSDFAPALLGVAEACQRANTVLNPNCPELSIRVKADIESGSFHVALALLASAAVSALPNVIGYAKGAKEIADTLFPGEHSVVGVIKWLAGRDPRKIVSRNSGTPGKLILQIGKDTFEVNSDSWKLASDPITRKSLHKATAPLFKDGIDSLEIGAGSDRTIIEKQDVSSFSELPREQVIEEERHDEFEILSLSLERGASKFTDGEANFSAVISDKEFWAKVDSREYGFKKGDRLEVNLLVRKTRGVKLSSEYIITKVIRLITPPTLFDQSEKSGQDTNDKDGLDT